MPGRDVRRHRELQSDGQSRSRPRISHVPAFPKNPSKVRPEDLRGLRAFKDEYARAECRLLYRGSEWPAIGDVMCLPVGDFLENLRPGTDPPC